MHSTLESIFDKTLDFVNQLGSQTLLVRDAYDEKEAKTFPTPRSAKMIFSAGPLDAIIPALRVALESPFGSYVTVFLASSPIDRPNEDALTEIRLLACLESQTPKQSTRPIL